MKIKSKGHLTEVFALILAAFLVIADQVTKSVIADSFYLGETVAVIPRVLNFTYIHNRGAVFGILKDHPWVFNSATIICVAVALVLLVLGKIKKKMYIWATGLIIAGGIGNMIDRLSLKYVVDFIEVKFIYFPYIFNIADCCVVIGCSLIALQLIIEIIEEKKEKKKAEISSSTDDEAENSEEKANE